MSSSLYSLRDLPAPAKINLFLHITGRRTDGYHLIESVFQLVDWQDTLHLTLRSDGHISREDLLSGAGAELPSDDLCMRAARALQQATGCAMGAHIQLEKRIPTQAGMGGGSSDAATCLLGLNRMWNLRQPLSKLEQIGLSLGADVPFFLRGRNAWVTGIGEVIAPLPENVLNANQHFIIVKPQNGLPTPVIFGHQSLKRDTPHTTIEAFTANPYDFGRNDLQGVAEVLEHQVYQALVGLRRRGLLPRMTGSGSAVFAPCPAGFQIGATTIPANWQRGVCKALDIHPILDRLQN